MMVMYMQFNTTRRHKKFEPGMYGSSRRNRGEKYKSMVRDKVVEEEWKYRDVNEHWQKMKEIMMETAQHTRGMFVCLFVSNFAEKLLNRFA